MNAVKPGLVSKSV